MLKFLLRVNTRPLRHIVLGIDPIQFAPARPIDVRFAQTGALFTELDDIDQRFEGGLVKDDINLGRTDAALEKQLQVRYNAWDFDFSFDPMNGDYLSLFGRSTDRMAPLRYDTAKSAGQWAQQFLTANRLTHPHPRRLYYFDKFLTLARSCGATLSIYTNPLHPLMVRELTERTPYMKTQALLAARLRASGHPNIRFHPFATPADFGGDDADFFDGVHMGGHNGDRLLDYLLSKDL